MRMDGRRRPVGIEYLCDLSIRGSEWWRAVYKYCLEDVHVMFDVERNWVVYCTIHFVLSLFAGNNKTRSNRPEMRSMDENVTVGRCLGMLHDELGVHKLRILPTFRKSAADPASYPASLPSPPPSSSCPSSYRSWPLLRVVIMPM